jgi:carbon storage regulator
MLVLSRMLDERVIITTPSGETIIVTLLEVRGGNKARLGFTAAKEVKVHREEVQKAIAKESHK